MTDDFLIGFKTAEKLKNGSIGWSAFKSELNYSYLFSDCKFPGRAKYGHKLWELLDATQQPDLFHELVWHPVDNAENIDIITH